MGIKEYLARHLLLADGAMGTQIQLRQPGAAAWGKYEGCNEWLNLSAPEIIRDIHAAYFAAGSDAVETNSFGASPITLGEYGLAEKAREILPAERPEIGIIVVLDNPQPMRTGSMSAAPVFKQIAEAAVRHLDIF